MQLTVQSIVQMCGYTVALPVHSFRAFPLSNIHSLFVVVGADVGIGVGTTGADVGICVGGVHLPHVPRTDSPLMSSHLRSLIPEPKVKFNGQIMSEPLEPVTLI